MKKRKVGHLGHTVRKEDLQRTLIEGMVDGQITNGRLRYHGRVT